MGVFGGTAVSLILGIRSGYEIKVCKIVFHERLIPNIFRDITEENVWSIEVE
jgi:hypothetical protein